MERPKFRAWLSPMKTSFLFRKHRLASLGLGRRAWQLVGVKVRCNGDHTPSVGCELSVHCVGMCTTRATAAYVDLP